MKKKASRSIDVDSETVERGVRNNNFMTIDDRRLSHYGAVDMIQSQPEPTFVR